MLKAILVLLFLPTVGFAADQGHFREIKRLKLGGTGGWDYVNSDTESRKLYIARSDRIMVVDLDSGALLGEVKGLDGAHGTAIAKEINRGFASSGKSGEVFVFDLKTFAVLEKIKVGDGPDAIIYDAPTKKIFSFNGKSQDFTVIDSVTRKAAPALALNGKPEFAVSDGKSRVFVAIENKNEVVSIDTKSNKILSRWVTAPCEEPTGISMDEKKDRLIVGCGNKLAIIMDSNTGKILEQFKVGEGVDATAFDPVHKLAFISAGEGLLTILSENDKGFQLVQNLETEKRARTLAVDHQSGNVFLPIAKFEDSTGPKKRNVIPGSFEVIVESNTLSKP